MAKNLVAFTLCFGGYVIYLEQDFKNTQMQSCYTFHTKTQLVWILSYFLFPLWLQRKISWASISSNLPATKPVFQFLKTLVTTYVKYCCSLKFPFAPAT